MPRPSKRRRPLESLVEQASALPAQPGVYTFRDEAGRLLYVGKAKDLKQRVRSYLGKDGGHSRPTRRLRRLAHHITHVPTGSELEALVLEARTISAALPSFNMQGKHDRHFAYVRLSSDRHPKVQVVRRLVPDGSRYYGPYLSESALHEALDAIQRLVGWRLCDPLGPAPCLHHELGRCVAPCLAQHESAHDEAIATLVQVLEGHAEPVSLTLENRMREAADKLQFETAARMRDGLQALAKLSGWARLSPVDAVLISPLQDGWRLVAVRMGRLAGGETLATGPEGWASAHGFLGRLAQLPVPGPAQTSAAVREMALIARYLARPGKRVDVLEGNLGDDSFVERVLGRLAERESSR
ncbi:MAG: GIY-YIG nuclease family protein [Candidatus Sericytochromatia bacterium]|nr:GIY-YIG nuclease family protein [Candidatus Sericytochromatia bacterium]